MVSRQLLTRLFVVVVALALVTAGLGLAQGPNPPEQQETQGLVIPSTPTARRIPIQGRLTDAGGNPLTGEYTVVLTLYNTATGATSICSDTKIIAALNGLFTTYMDGCSRSDINGRQLYLGIRVGADPEMTPRQPIYAVPYAWSLLPGAEVVGEQTNWNAIYADNMAPTNLSYGVRARSASPQGRGVSGENYGGGYGVYAESNGAGGSGSALYAKNTNASGVAGWLKNNNSADSTLVLENLGAGGLIKGFGGDGGEDEFRVSNRGSIETKADSYVFVPGIQAVPAGGTTSVSLAPWEAGAVTVDPSGSGTRTIVFGIPLQGVLYGQPVKAEEVTVYYRTSWSGTYIDQTIVYRQMATGAPNTYVLANNADDRNSMTYTNYDVALSGANTLSANEGFLSVALRLYFDAGDESITIGGVRVRLGHHSLY